MIKKFIYRFIAIMAIVIVSFNNPKSVNALAKFSTSYQINYTVQPNGSTHVKFFINQKNNLSVVYATDFSLSVNHTKISNVRVVDENVVIPADITRTKNQTSITFSFANKIVGKDKNHFFSVEYDTEDVATKFGNTWQINIPKLETDENLVDQNIILTVPTSFPKPAYVDPKPSVIVNNVYYFSGNSLSNKTISAVFGQSQTFKAHISYHLSNDTNSKSEQTISIPPDTNYQKVYIENIHPKPNRFEKDDDGNLLAYYILKPHSKIDISLTEFIKLNFKPEANKFVQVDKYLQNNEIWDYENNLFTMSEVQNLKSAKSIYEYVSGKLTYDYQKVNKTKSQKIPASESLKTPTSAICTDFSNIFVALARKAGIPARELEGYAFSENPDLKPLSLTQDVLHAWPEYYNKETSTWTQIDPTWSNTTHGVDYFNKLDLNHIVFVIHGTSPIYPISAGGYKNGNEKTKDVEIAPVDEIVFPKPSLSIESASQNESELNLSISNQSGVGYYGDIIVEKSNFFEKTESKIDIPPYNIGSVKIQINKIPLIRPQKNTAIIYLNGQVYEHVFTIQPRIPTIGLLTGGVILLGTIALTARNLYLRRRKS